MFPREFIQSFLQGYSVDELKKIENDLVQIDAFSFEDAKPHSGTGKLRYIATAGGPGSLKTTTLETYMRENKLEDFVYADPDQISLKNMSRTYIKSLHNLSVAESKSTYEALKKAYNKWRGASNYICHKILHKAFGGDDYAGPKYFVAHGTTSTNPKISEFYKKIKAQNYKIELLLCYSPDEIRKQSIEKREKEQAFVQVDPTDIISKGQDFPRRFDTYFEYGDTLHFYWNDKLEHGTLPKSCANYVKATDKFTIINVDAWNNFCQKYYEDCATYQIEVSEVFKKMEILGQKLIVSGHSIFPKNENQTEDRLGQKKTKSLVIS